MEYLICEKHNADIYHIDSSKKLICKECNTDADVYLLCCENCKKLNVRYISKIVFKNTLKINIYGDKYISVRGIYCEECAFDIKEGKSHLIKCVYCNRNSNIECNHSCDSDCKEYGCYNNCNQMFVSKHTLQIYCPDCASGIFVNTSDLCSIVCYMCNNVDPTQFYNLERYNNPRKWSILHFKNDIKKDKIQCIKHPNIYCSQCFYHKSVRV